LDTTDFVVIVAYFAALAAIGVYFARRQTTREEYYLAGRSVHWLLVGGSVLATLLSTITYLSIPGEMVRYGVTFFFGSLMVPLMVPVVAGVIIPTITRMPITSAYEYLEKRFGRPARRLASTVFLVHTMVWTGLIFYTASLAVAQVAGWRLLPTILVMGLVTIFYTAAGGIRTVIWTDNLQLLILFGGALLIPALVALSTGTGPVAWWQSFSHAGRSSIIVFSWDPTVRMTLVGICINMFCWELCTHSSDQVAVQRYLTTPSLQAARNSLWTYAAFRLALGFLLAFCGLALFAFYHAKSGLAVGEFQQQVAPVADRLMPRFIAEELRGGVGGLMIAALLAAAMSSLSSAINSAAGVISSDFLRHRGGSLAADRLLVAGGGVFGMAVAVSVHFAMERLSWNLVEMTGRLNHIWVGPLASLFFAGALAPRVGQSAAILGFAVGSILSLTICFSRISFIWLVAGSLITAVLSAVLASYLFRPPDRERVAELLYRPS
jgi:SSS family solute:Na+ symporter